MNKKPFSLLLVLFLSPFLLNCATTQDVQSTNIRVSSINEKIEELQSTTVKKQASSSERLDQLQADILRIDGQLEENAHYHRTLREESKEMKTSLVSHMDSMSRELIEKINSLNNRLAKIDERLSGLDEKIIATRAEMDKIKEAQAAEAAERAGEAAERAREAAAALEKAKAESARARAGALELVPDKMKRVVAEDEIPADDKGPDKSDSGSDLYENALALFKADKFKEAYNGFSAYAAKYPAGDMTANARFWMGDSLYRQQEFELAILEYQKVVTDFPAHEKAAAALLKQGMAFEKLNDTNPAVIIYNKLISEYPDSGQVATARKRLESLQ